VYELIKTDGAAKRGRLTTPHGVIETPVFMNVATSLAVKGAVSAGDLAGIGCQVALANTYHLHVRPGDGAVRQMGGARRFMAWNGPMLTDSGGFQVFSLAGLRKITEDGAVFSSHVDGRKIFMTPELSMEIQCNLGSTIAMAFDECVANPSPREYVAESAGRTTRWLERCLSRFQSLKAGEGALNPGQLIFGINQGGTFLDIRVSHARTISGMAVDGCAIGGLAVGERHEEMYSVVEAVTPVLPKDKPTYLMGVGTPENILECVARGVDFFDCVLPARNGRHAHVYTSRGKLNLMNAGYALDGAPIDEECDCPACLTYSRAYIRHLFKAGEMLAMRLCVLHNLHFYNRLMGEIRSAVEAGNYAGFMKRKLESFERVPAARR
jgi:queuine tRNA-ribosyltransferase